MWFFKLIFFSVILNLVNCYDIFVFFPFPGKSHTILGHGYVRHLLKAGHNVTYVTPIPMKNPPKNLRIVDISSNMGHDEDLVKIFNINTVLNKVSNPLTDMDVAFQLMHGAAVEAVTHENVQKLLMDPSEKFDVAILEWLFSDVYAGISAAFDCPLIWSSSVEPHSQVLRLIGGTTNPSYVPDIMSYFMPPLSYKQRVIELYTYLKLHYKRWNHQNMFEKSYEEIYRPIFQKRGKELPPFNDVLFNASLILGNSHVSQGVSFPLPQNYKAIAGYHIDDDIAPLPKNLQEIFDNAEHGVIYFSLGTMMEGKHMPDAIKKGLLKTFSKFKQTVVWKLEIPLPDLPSNVHIVHWAPQQSILAHPNTVLFITHGGLLSLLETINVGVPVIGIPLFGDQIINIERMTAKGVAIKVEMNYEVAENLEEAMRDILDDPSYREAMRELSMIFNKRPLPPGKELVYWVEHVIETNGAKYMRSAGLMVPWYQAIFLDVIALLILSAILIYYLTRHLIRKVVSMFCRSEKKKVS